MTAVGFTINGRPVQAELEPRLLLADYLRGDLGLRGTHLGCEHGICGACTVLVDGEPARSCLMLAVQADGHELTTVEGMAGDGELHPIQQAFHENHALQCGFCTPGLLLTTDFLLRQPMDFEDEDAIRAALSGNICRCTGYQNIVEAVRAAAARLSSKEG